MTTQTEVRIYEWLEQKHKTLRKPMLWTAHCFLLLLVVFAFIRHESGAYLTSPWPALAALMSLCWTYAVPIAIALVYLIFGHPILKVLAGLSLPVLTLMLMLSGPGKEWNMIATGRDDSMKLIFLHQESANLYVAGYQCSGGTLSADYSIERRERFFLPGLMWVQVLSVDRL